MIMPQTMIDVVAAGGGLTINLETQMIMPSTMEQIAATAAKSGALITFKTGKSVIMPQTMIDVAAAGKGRVVFEIS